MSSRKYTFIWLFNAAVLFGVNAAPPRKFAPGNEFPYLVSLRERKGDFLIYFCGGAIISPQHILTAAHCLNNRTLTNVEAKVGSSFLTSGGSIHKFKDGRTPIGFKGIPLDPNALYDVAVLTLNEPLSQKYRNWEVIKLASRDYPPGTSVVFAGWGSSFQNATFFPDQLRIINTKLAGISECANHISSFNKNHHVCIVPTNGRGACQGDSGGPLVVNGEVIGVSSYTGVCGHSSSIFAKVFVYKGLIEKMTGNSKVA